MKLALGIIVVAGATGLLFYLVWELVVACVSLRAIERQVQQWEDEL